MFQTFQAGSNTATNGTTLLGNDANGDVVIKKIIIGAPVSSGNIWIYNISNPVNAATTNIAFKTTLPATLPTTGAALVNVIDFTSAYCRGLQLVGGGNLIIDQTMNVTVIWDRVDNDDQ